MELRDPGCRKCQRVTSGDCGEHGPRVIPGKITGSREREPLVIESTPEVPDPIFPKMQATLIEATTPLFHFICSLNPDHVVYVKIGYGVPPAPTICPWKCGWMNRVGEVAARGL